MSFPETKFEKRAPVLAKRAQQSTDGSRLRSGVAPAPARPNDDEFERAIDTFAVVIRTFGRYSVGAGVAQEEAQKVCEKWARHILVVGPRPGDPEDAKGAARRDWQGLGQFVAGMRRAESETVGRSMTTLRETLTEFLGGLRSIVSEDGRAEQDVQAQIERLRAAVASESLAELKSEALSVSGALTNVLEARKQAQQTVMQELSGRVRDLSRELEETRKQGAQDALTKVANRMALDEYIGKVVGLDGLFGKATCLLMVDIDHFKQVNDTFGHPTGDDILRKLGDVLNRTFPRKTDFVARYGGEEFAVILRDTSLREAAIPAQRLLTAARGVAIAREGGWNISVSVGLAQLAEGETSDQWMARADRALYTAKHEGRNRVVEAK
jgi:diguanylate cyclase (GGDEF)-like protein